MSESLTVTDDNPYQAPDAELKLVSIDSHDDELTARSVFLAWEKLRLAYNGILIAETVIFTGVYGTFVDSSFWPYAILRILGANFCFCTGQNFEGYLNLVGIRREPARGIVFALGTTFSILVVAGAIFLRNFKGID